MLYRKNAANRNKLIDNKIHEGERQSMERKFKKRNILHTYKPCKLNL